VWGVDVVSQQTTYAATEQCKAATLQSNNTTKQCKALATLQSNNSTTLQSSNHRHGRVVHLQAAINTGEVQELGVS
jgi:hypothetical protein